MTVFCDPIAQALGTDLTSAISTTFQNEAQYRSYFNVTDLALASIKAATLEYAALIGAEEVTLDRRLALLSFLTSTRPCGWTPASLFDPVAGDYQCGDGWVRLHTNAPHHKAAALEVLGCGDDPEAVKQVLRHKSASEIEAAVVANNGCAAEMRSTQEWAKHPQGQAVAQEPLIHWSTRAGDAKGGPSLRGVKVLDLTRVLAGPVGTRYLASFGADVLRIDPPHWNEPPVELEVTPGKRCAGLDLTKSDDRATFETLLSEADLFVHGYRPGALAAMGYDAVRIAQLNPNLCDVSLCAYGWTGPWAGRRGFDSLVQMSCGIADTGMKGEGADHPVPLPVQALDYATGYLVAAAAIRALNLRQSQGQIASAKLSLAKTADLLMSDGVKIPMGEAMKLREYDVERDPEMTSWGPVKRLYIGYGVRKASKPVIAHWDINAGRLRRHEARWASP